MSVNSVDPEPARTKSVLLRGCNFLIEVVEYLSHDYRPWMRSGSRLALVASMAGFAALSRMEQSPSA